MDIEISLDDQIDELEVVELYRANAWSSADKPERLLPALRNSDSLVTARHNGLLIGLGNAISDGFLVVYYPHLLVHPKFQGQGVGRKMLASISVKYRDFHQQMLTADGRSIDFYKSVGFERAGETEPMWIYAGTEH
jgi:GNAT superfamily N-acetyltransferase